MARRNDRRSGSGGEGGAGGRRGKAASGRGPGGPAGADARGPKTLRGSIVGGRLPPGTLPTKDQVLEYLASAQAGGGKREIGRAFGIKGGDRIGLKRLLAEMTAEGLLAGNRKQLKERGRLPPMLVIEIGEPDDEGELTGRPVAWDESEGPEPRIRVSITERARAASLGTIGPGERVLARATPVPPGTGDGYDYTAEPVKKLARERRRLLGIYRAASRSSGRDGGVIAPIDRRDLKEWPVQEIDRGEARNGDLVRYEISTVRHTSRARILEVIGNPGDQKQISLIAVHAHGIPEDFSKAALAEVEALRPPDLSKRTDLRGMPLLTIDPVDARDHDDAVHATPDTDPRNPDGWIVTVAIADVAHYVRPGTRLDHEAERRGNSVYFPDRVVPMLPERISNDLCSLRAGEDRACLAVRMIFTANGDKTGHTFMRAVMRSPAKLNYAQAQAAIDGKPDDATTPLFETALKPLWAAYAVLAKARDRRSPLDLDLPERRIIVGKDGTVERVFVPERLAAHRLIEEFMIQANVAAAEQLEARRTPVIYRAHAEPSREKLMSLGQFLETLDLVAPKPGSAKAQQFNRILAEAKGKPYAELVNEVVLRSQAQAEYTPQNYGHFGLNLRRYAHFTSPIRRYADLVVHRALIKALGLGPDGLDEAQAGRLVQVCETISQTERRAMAAERETTERLIAAHLADRVGAKFDARISGVTRSGLFVRLRETGADGFIPAATLGTEYFAYDEDNHLLVGEKTGEAYRLGDTVEVKLVEAIPTAGALRFEMLTEGKRGLIPHRKGGIRAVRRMGGAPRKGSRGRR
jgi:ribonuclease R